ncbi:hypothetical protein [Halomonas llamarensis]|uniref:Phage tail protein n=1 Tax=Halomonas llamarensis TaxID=2945104 RepID=A0ABT0SS35_9GAMM|nr:hypothetical protein [Halomonas llamarensis]MCL7930441.1 hypothetical protein [Halomonas llamarensis]
MEKQVIYRDRQELQAADLENTQGWGDDALAHVISDAISSERHYTGLAVSSNSATELTIDPGRLYDGSEGHVYAIDNAQIKSVFSMLPLQDEKWLAVSVVGQENDTNLEPRDFLIDLQTREVEPQTVAMQRARVADVHIAQGLESPTPEKPEPPTGYTLIAHVRLTSSGIQEIVLAENRRLPNLQRVAGRVDVVEGWIDTAEPRIAHIQSDIAGLADSLNQRATIEQAIQLGMDMAKVKERLEIPDDYVFYGADHYLDGRETDTTQADYNAHLDEGVRFAQGATVTTQLDIDNPLDGAASLSAEGFLLPRYDERARMRLENRAGELTINQYQYQTVETVQRTMTRQHIRYGATRTVCTNGSFWRSGEYDIATGIFSKDGETFEVEDDRGRRDGPGGLTHWVRVKEFWVDEYEEAYWSQVTTSHTIQGSVLAQTFLSAQTGWHTSAEIYFTSVANDGAVTVMLTAVKNGQPDTSKVLSRATLTANGLEGGWQKIPWSRPVFIEAGKRYALVISSGGAHRVGFGEGTEYTQGLLMYAQDGDYFNEAEERDLMLRLNFAKFRSPRAAIQLKSLELAGGIHDIDMLFEGFRPAGTELAFQYRIGGEWYSVEAGTAERLGVSPALLPLRVVFTGTTDLMPGLLLTDSQVKLAQHGTEFRHYSTERSLTTPSDTIIIRTLVEDFDDDAHTLDATLVIDGATVNADNQVTEVVDRRSYWLESRFNLASPANAYTIRLDGQTNDPFKGYHVAERYDIAL